MQCDWFLDGTFVFKTGYQFKAKYGWNVEKMEDNYFDVEGSVSKQLLCTGKFMDSWEVELQKKRLVKKNKEKRLFQTNELDLGGLNKSKIINFRDFNIFNFSERKRRESYSTERIYAPFSRNINPETSINCSETLKSNFSHCLQEDIPNSIEPVFNCFKRDLAKKNDTQNREVENPEEHEEKRQWVILEGELKDKEGRVIMKYYNKTPSNKKSKRENKLIPIIEGEPVVFYYGPEKNYGLIIYPRVSVLGHACFYEGYIQYGKPSDQGVFIGANCRYLIHSLDQMGSGVIKCLNYCNMFPFTKCKVFNGGKVEKCTSLLANGFIFYGLDEYGTGFFKLYGLDKLIRGDLNGENFKLEIKGDILYDSDSEDGKSTTVEDLLNQLRQEQITVRLTKAKQESENSGSKGKSRKELETISEQTKSRHTFDSTSKKQSNSMFKIFPNKSRNGTNSCSNFEDKSKGIDELLKEPKFLDTKSAVKTSRSNGTLNDDKNKQKNKNSIAKSIFSQNRDQPKKKSHPEFEAIQGKSAQGNHHRRVSKDSDFYMISDSSEQNRSKVNWYSMMNSEKSLITDGEKSQSRKASKSVKSEFTIEEVPKKNEYRGSLRLVQSPIAFEEDEIFGEISRRIS